MIRKRKTIKAKWEEECAAFETEMGGRTLANVDENRWREEIAAAVGNPVKTLEIYQRLVALNEATRRQREDQLLPILDDYNIPRADPNRWFDLCWWLALECGRIGVRPAKAPTKFDDEAYAVLIYRIAKAQFEIAAERGCTDKDVSVIDACRRIVQEHPEWYGTKKGGRVSAETLARRRREAPPSSFALLLYLLERRKESAEPDRI
jgi:hypothetical protein